MAHSIDIPVGIAGSERYEAHGRDHIARQTDTEIRPNTAHNN